MCLSRNCTQPKRQCNAIFIVACSVYIVADLCLEFPKPGKRNALRSVWNVFDAGCAGAVSLAAGISTCLAGGGMLGQFTYHHQVFTPINTEPPSNAASTHSIPTTKPSKRAAANASVSTLSRSLPHAYRTHFGSFWIFIFYIFVLACVSVYKCARKCLQM